EILELEALSLRDAVRLNIFLDTIKDLFSGHDAASFLRRSSLGPKFTLFLRAFLETTCRHQQANARRHHHDPCATMVAPWIGQHGCQLRSSFATTKEKCECRASRAVNL